jgi:tetratricopeptide (TPR) repeat protein
MRHLFAIALLVALAPLSHTVWAQGVAVPPPASTTPPDTKSDPKLDAKHEADAAIMNKVRRLLAEDKARPAFNMIDDWIDENEFSRSAWMPEALLLRGDAWVARGEEYDALYDYERIVKDFPGSENFEPALEREFEIAKMYLGGLRKKSLGLRLDSGVSVAEEIIIRIYERLPGSRLAELALLELADYYYRVRDLRSAADAYDVFLDRFPRSEFRRKAMQRRIYANIGQFKGPKYDASGLIEAGYQIEQYRAEFPAEAEREGMSDAMLARLDESAAMQMLTVARWYLKRSDPVSARLTLARLVQRHPRSGAAQEALRIFEEKKWTFDPAPPLDAPAPETPANDSEVVK